MGNAFRVVVLGCSCIVFAAGCPDKGVGGNVKLAPADGVVTYKGSPLAGATVTFMPEDGPLAIAVTDLEGEFTLASGAIPGCAIGPAKVTITVVAPGGGKATEAITMKEGPLTPAEMEAQQKKMATATTAYQANAKAGPPKSLIPANYADSKTSGLSFTIKADGDNHFTIELKD